MLVFILFILIYFILKLFISALKDYHFTHADEKLLLGPAYGLFKEATIFTFVLGIVLILQAFEAMPFLEG
jgi:hypothetical protein